MRLRAAGLLIVVLLFALGPTPPADAQQVPRLVADNRTDYYADIYVWNGSGWNYVTRLNPRHWTQFPNAANGSAWRAVFGQQVRDHVVNYAWDAGYGGWQSVWWIQ
jgi:hypothetical protein